MSGKKRSDAESSEAGTPDPNDGRVIEARNGDGEVVAVIDPTKTDKETPVRSAVDSPNPVESDRRATAEIVADCFNSLHKRIAHVERLQGIENEYRDRDTIISVTDRGTVE